MSPTLTPLIGARPKSGTRDSQRRKACDDERSLLVIVVAIGSATWICGVIVIAYLRPAAADVCTASGSTTPVSTAIGASSLPGLTMQVTARPTSGRSTTIDPAANVAP